LLFLRVWLVLYKLSFWAAGSALLGLAAALAQRRPPPEAGGGPTQN